MCRTGSSRTGLGSTELDNTQQLDQDLRVFYVVCVIALR